MKSKIRIKDIALKANVSVGTVDRVLHNRGDVNPETRSKVMGIVDQLGYVPNLLAKSLGSKKVVTFAVLVPVADSDHAYWKLPLQGIESAGNELKDYNTQVVVHHFNPADVNSFSEQFDKVLEAEPEGIVFTPVFESLSLEYAHECKMRNIPLVCLEINLDSDDILGYFGQDANGSGNMAGRLMEQILPEKSTILLLNIARKMTVTSHLRKRTKGFLNYFANPRFKKDLKIDSLSLDISDEAVLVQTLAKAFQEDVLIKGIFVTSSQVSWVAKSLVKLGREDVLLIGYDLLDDNLYYLEQGTIDFLIGHKPEEHGFKSVMALFNYVNNMGNVGRVNLSPIDIIMRENIGYYKNKKLI